MHWSLVMGGYGVVCGLVVHWSSFMVDWGGMVRQHLVVSCGCMMSHGMMQNGSVQCMVY